MPQPLPLVPPGFAAGLSELPAYILEYEAARPLVQSERQIDVEDRGPVGVDRAAAYRAAGPLLTWNVMLVSGPDVTRKVERGSFTA